MSTASSHITPGPGADRAATDQAPPTAPPRRRGRRKTRGQALVEFSLILPVFLFVLWGILDFGLLLYSRMTVINATREGARAASVAVNPTTIPTVAAGRVQAVASGLTTSSPTMTITTSCVAIVSPSCNWSSMTSSQPGDAVSVTVSYQYSSFFPLLFGTQIPFSSTVQMVLE
jgi:Flp pilus assembly protein TadG